MSIDLLSELKEILKSDRKEISFCDYMDLVFDIRVPDFWRPVVKNISNEKRLLILLPPGHRKTTTMVGYAAWCLATKKRLRIAIATHTITYSSVILNQICDILESPTSVALVGKVIPENPERNTKGWTKTTRWIYEDIYIKDPNLVALGVGSSTIGFRADLIICDDVVTQNNSMTPVMREKISSWFWGALYPRLEPDGQIIVVGSRFYEGDLYEEILRQKKDWTTVIMATSPEKPLWPERFDSEWLKQKYESNPLFFKAQYMQIPVKDKSVLDVGWLHFHYSLPDEVSYFIGVDPCDKADGVDYFALIVLARDKFGRTFVVDGVKKKLDVLEQVKEILWFSSRYHPVCVAIEDRGALHPLLKDSGLNIRIVRYSTPKQFRIQRLAEEFRMQKITLPMVTSETPAEVTKLFLEEWRNFGSAASHDDLLDAAYNAFIAVLEGTEPAATYATTRNNNLTETGIFQTFGGPKIWIQDTSVD